MSSCFTQSRTAAAPKRTARGSQFRADDSDALFVELLDTRSCLDVLPRLNEFENSVFGPDFAISLEEMEAWAESGCWFCAAVAGQAVVGRRQIVSVISVLVTTNECRERLLAGEAFENQLRPWAAVSKDLPAIYFASVISASADHLRRMYDSLSRDLREFRSTWGARLEAGFGIAAGPAGFTHMTRNGFRHLEGSSYLGHYPLMDIAAQSAATPFWQDLLCRDPVLPSGLPQELQGGVLFTREAVASF